MIARGGRLLAVGHGHTATYIHGRDELLVALDGGSGGAAGWFALEVIKAELQRPVAAWHRPWRLCVRVVAHHGGHGPHYIWCGY